MTARRRDMLALLAGGPMASPLLAATPGVDVPPEPGTPQPLRLPSVGNEVLPGGLRLLTVPRAGLPLVTATLYVRAGREADPLGQAGLAGLVGSVINKGCLRQGREIAATQIAREAEALGSALDVSTTWRITSLSMTVTTPQLDAALALLTEVARAPLFKADEIERARTQLLDGLRVTLASPGDVASLTARRAFWGDSAFGAAMTPASLQRLTRNDVLAFHGRWYRPDNSVLVLAGDVPADAAVRAAAHAAEWRAGSEPLATVKPAAPQSLATQRWIVEMPGSGQSGVTLVAPFAAIDAADRRIGEVAATLLGGGYSARLNQEIRIKRGLSYGAFGGGESQSSGGMFIARTQTKHESGPQVAQLMIDELLRVAREDAPVAELDARKATMVGSFTRQLDTTAALADQVASQWFQGRPLDALGRYVDDVMAVTPAQVREFAAKYWTAERVRVVIAGVVPASSSGDSRRIPMADLDLDQATLTKP